MTLRELNQLVDLGEGTSLEFKHRVPRPERIAKEMIAFANTRGGRILLGVSDDGTLMGVGDAVEEEFLLRVATQRFCQPPIEYTTERVVIEPRCDVIVVHVAESNRKPHHLAGPSTRNGAQPGPVYMRMNERSVEANADSVRLMREEQPQDAVTFQFGENESLLMRYLDDYGRITVQQFAQLADISRYRASQTLSSMARANVLRAHRGDGEDYFTLAY